MQYDVDMSEISLKEAIEMISGFSPVKIIFNGVVLYNDYDSDVEVEEGVYGEVLPPSNVIPSRLWNFEKYVVTTLNIEIVDFHHSVVTILGGYKNTNDERV